MLGADADESICRKPLEGDGNQFFVLYRNYSIGDRRLVKGPKGLHYFRREAVHILREEVPGRSRLASTGVFTSDQLLVFR